MNKNGTSGLHVPQLKSVTKLQTSYSSKWDQNQMYDCVVNWSLNKSDDSFMVTCSQPHAQNLHTPSSWTTLWQTYKLGGVGLRSFDSLLCWEDSGVADRLRRWEGGVLDREREDERVFDRDRECVLRRGGGDGDLDRDRDLDLLDESRGQQH